MYMVVQKIWKFSFKQTFYFWFKNYNIVDNTDVKKSQNLAAIKQRCTLDLIIKNMTNIMKNVNLYIIYSDLV